MIKKTFDLLSKLPLSRSGDRAPRVPSAVWVSLSRAGDSKSIRGQTVNLSRSGLLVRYWGVVPTSWQMGDELNLIIEPDTRFFDEPIECPATVVRIGIDVDAPEHRMTIALRFKA